MVVRGGLWLRCCGVAAACLFFTRGSVSSPRNTQQGLLAEGTRLTTSAIWALVVDCGPDGVATPPHRRGGPAMCWGRRAGAGTDRQQNSRQICQSFAAAQSRVRWCKTQAPKRLPCMFTTIMDAQHNTYTVNMLKSYKIRSFYNKNQCFSDRKQCTRQCARVPCSAQIAASATHHSK